MLGDELGVEQAIAACLKPRDKMHERDLRRIARAMKHALAEEGAAQRHAIEAADQFDALIDLDGVAVAALEQCAIDAPDARVDPGPATVGLRLGATVDHGLEVAVNVHRE